MPLKRPALRRGRRRTPVLNSALTSVTALALLAALAVQPGSLPQSAGSDRARNASDSYDWLEDTATEQLRQDQCLMNNVLRLGGTSLASMAQDGLDLPPDALHTAANPKYWEHTPLAQAYVNDTDTADAAGEALSDQVSAWKGPLSGLDYPWEGFSSNADFYWPPGSNDGKENFYQQTGLSQWYWGRFWQSESALYEDSTPLADATTQNSVTTQGAPLYTYLTDTSIPTEERNGSYEEALAFEYLSHDAPMGVDNARIFLESGGFPRSAPQTDSAEFRIAVEDLKTRFSTCAWRDPADPNKVLGDEVSTAAAEWQQEIASQAAQRNQILDANTSATKSLASGAKILGNMLGNSWVADHLVRWQSYWSPGGAGSHEPSQPNPAQFDQANKELAKAQAVTKAQLIQLKLQAAAVKRAATTTDTAQQAAFTIADANGMPRGRGLMAGQQKAQVTAGADAALEAMVIAGQTAEAATHATASDSKTIAQRALAQAAQSKAEFRKKAAQAAEQQAKASAAAAKVHRDNAKKDKETAESKLADAVKAEADAKAAAADAHAKRLAAEAEEKTAKAEKATAAAKQSEAAEHKKNAETYQSTAVAAQKKAETAATTASEKRTAAETARDSAKDKRDDAWDAEQKANAARAKADAKEAYADAHDADENAGEARTAANEADAAATEAETAAAGARTEADAATQAAADADAAATRAEAAAKRARSDADGAQAAKLRADAAVKTATSAAADAIAASQHAASEAKTAVELADEAEQEAKDARTNADAAKKESVKAQTAASKAAGYAYVTAQAADDAKGSAAQVTKPANDAIQLGSPYVSTDATASLVVLAGQGSKTIAEQQLAVADAHAKNAQKEAALAQSLADKASADTKAALQSAANAAASAAEARGYSKEALGYSADAATAAAKAVASLARTIGYDNQATIDAEAADKAAGRAEGYAKDARDSADQAALDADAANAAATAAEEAAKEARTAADQAAADATAAEEAAKDAQTYAESAQEAAESAEREEANQQVSTGAGTGIGATFYVVDDIKVTKADQQNPCEIKIGFEGCEVTFTTHFDATLDFYVCTDPNVPATRSGCPQEETVFLGTKTFANQTKEITSYFSKLDILQQTIVYQVLKEILIGDFVDCWHGSVSGCAWAASNFIPGKAIEKLVEGIRALDAAMKTGIGVADAFKALKALDVNPATLADIQRSVNTYEDLRTACTINSFPGDTQVLMADGTSRAISELSRTDRVLATDPVSGELRPEPVLSTYGHGTDRLVDIALAGGAQVSSTVGHRFFVVDRGWTVVADLEVGDRLRTKDDKVRTVTALRDRTGLTNQRVYDLTVDNLHTFYVLAGDSAVLVHNCSNLVADAVKFAGQAHILEKHVSSEATALARAQRDNDKISVFNDLATAQQVVDQVLAAKAGEITKWLRGNQQRKTLTGTMGGKDNSLGFVAHPDGSTVTRTGNGFVIILQRAPGHKPGGYYVFTGYPK